MGRGEARSPAGEPVRSADGFPGIPEAAAVSAAVFIYSSAGIRGGAVLLAAFVAGILACAAGLGLRYALALPGILPACDASTPFSARRGAARFANACLVAAAIGAGLAFGCAVCAEQRAASAEWTGIPAGSVRTYQGRLGSDSRATSAGAALYDLEIDTVESRFFRAGARAKISLIAEGGPPLAAGEKLRVSGRLPADGKPAFCQAVDIRVLGFGSGFDALRARARALFIASVSRIQSSGRGLLVALMTGDKSKLPPREERAFKLAGCAHILALSGQHIGILAALLGFLLIPLFGKRPSLILSSAIVVVYLIVTGIQPSMLRSVLSYLIAAAAWFLGRKPRSTSVLAWTFLVACALQPESPTTASFCLSYGATAGIILFQERIANFLSKWLPPALAKDLGVSLGACAASAPLSIALFGSFNPVCVLVSTAAGPLVSLMMWIGCAGSLACALLPFPFVGAAFGILLELPYRLLRGLVDWGAACPGLAFGPGFPRAAACAVLACIILLLYAWRLNGPARIRFPQVPQEIHGRARLRHAEEIRPELLSLAERPSQDRLAG
jgi:ComEC/Rec2-related protein